MDIAGEQETKFGLKGNHRGRNVHNSGDKNNLGQATNKLLSHLTEQVAAVLWPGAERSSAHLAWWDPALRGGHGHP